MLFYQIPLRHEFANYFYLLLNVMLFSLNISVLKKEDHIMVGFHFLVYFGISGILYRISNQLSLIRRKPAFLHMQKQRCISAVR